MELLGAQSELGVPTDTELINTAVDKITDRRSPNTDAEGEATSEDDLEQAIDLEQATAATLDAEESDGSDSDATTVR